MVVGGIWMMMGFGVQRRGVKSTMHGSLFFSFFHMCDRDHAISYAALQSILFYAFFPSCILSYIALMPNSPLHWSFLLAWIAQTTLIYAMPQFNEGLFYRGGR